MISTDTINDYFFQTSLHRFDGGLQPGEEPLPTEPVTGGGEPAVRTAPAVDEAVVRQVAEMGFPEAACRKAVSRVRRFHQMSHLRVLLIDIIRST